MRNDPSAKAMALIHEAASNDGTLNLRAYVAELEGIVRDLAAKEPVVEKLTQSEEMGEMLLDPFPVYAVNETTVSPSSELARPCVGWAEWKREDGKLWVRIAGQGLFLFNAC